MEETPYIMVSQSTTAEAISVFAIAGENYGYSLTDDTAFVGLYYGERYNNIDMQYFERSMSTTQFRAFINFIGEDAIGFVEEDLGEVYYPDDVE
jgi:hypothetical protein